MYFSDVRVDGRHKVFEVTKIEINTRYRYIHVSRLMRVWLECLYRVLAMVDHRRAHTSDIVYDARMLISPIPLGEYAIS